MQKAVYFRNHSYRKFEAFDCNTVETNFETQKNIY